MIDADTIRQILARHSAILVRYHVANLWLFGSAARQQLDAQDLDFMVEFSQSPDLLDYMELKFFLEETFKVPVDLHTRNSCPQRFFDRIREDLKHVA